MPMKTLETEEFLKTFGHNDKIEMKKDIYEYISINSNPEILTILRDWCITIPVFI